MSNDSPFTLIFLNVRDPHFTFLQHFFERRKCENCLGLKNKKKFNLLTDHYLSSFASLKV